MQERPGSPGRLQKEAFEDILDQEFEQMPAYGDILGRLKIAILRDRFAEWKPLLCRRASSENPRHGLQSQNSCRHYRTDPYY